MESELRHKFNDLFTYIGEAEIENKDFDKELNRFLDLLLGEDYFGTEGQSDPRKDWRN